MFGTRISSVFRPLMQPVRRFASESHPDFARRVKAPMASEADVHARIKRDLGAADVVVYMKGTPDAPQCGFSQAAVKVLRAEGVQFKAHNVLADESLRTFIKTFADWPTIPQIFVKGEFIGGCDILVGMYQSGELAKLFEEKGIKRQ